MNNSGHKVGFFGWHQLLTPQPEVALAFYQSLLGWEVESGEVEGLAHHTLFNGDAPVASILAAPDEAGEAMPHWHPHLNVGDMDDCLDRVEELGGRVIVEPGDIPGLGLLAVIQDPTGAVLTLISQEGTDDVVPDAVDVDGD